MNEKISIKFEKDLLEQIYKFRDGSNVENYNDAIQFIDDLFFRKVFDIFFLMSEARFQRWSALENNTQTDSFDHIV
ncbi:MAG: hypothetical protein IPN49_14135 [Saprospiraceae bacterium]|nr:hypothetical protein [Saprospiraceae bacterium]